MASGNTGGRHSKDAERLRQGTPDSRPPADFAARLGRYNPSALSEPDEERRWEGSYEFSQPSGSHLELRDFTVRSIEAAEVKVEKGAVGRARGGTVSIDQGAVGMALGREIHLKQAGGALVAGGKVTVEQGATQWLVGGLVEAKQVYAITVLAAKVEGQVKCLFDAKGAFAFGAGLALMSGLLRLMLRKK
ncbi:MAG TPA: hypothetical protein VGW38_07890 [Chloroflexota bacterium]|nr:hypothetical protein [Chloroflexota bacterium]